MFLTAFNFLFKSKPKKCSISGFPYFEQLSIFNREFASETTIAFLHFYSLVFDRVAPPGRNNRCEAVHRASPRRATMAEQGCMCTRMPTNASITKESLTGIYASESVNVPMLT